VQADIVFSSGVEPEGSRLAVGASILRVADMKVSIWTHESCFHIPGPEAWAVVIRYPDQEEQPISGFQANTTNNRAELTAILEALKTLAGCYEVAIYSDSQWWMNVLNRLGKAMCSLDLIDAIRTYAHDHSCEVPLDSKRGQPCRLFGIIGYAGGPPYSGYNKILAI